MAAQGLGANQANHAIKIDMPDYGPFQVNGFNLNKSNHLAWLGQAEGILSNILAPTPAHQGARIQLVAV